MLPQRDRKCCAGARRLFRPCCDQGGGEVLLPRAGLGEAGLETVDEGQQFVDLGDDAVLFVYGIPNEWNVSRMLR